ncbi:diacylglycerol/lipid kinase family protein [Thermodesulfobacteriota bacterium]
MKGVSKKIAFIVNPNAAMGATGREWPRIQNIDLGLIRYMDNNGKYSCRYFHNITSFGIGGEVAERVNKGNKALGGFISFIMATLVSLLTYDKKAIHLKVDSSVNMTMLNWHIAVANGQYQGGGMRVAPKARYDDGLFHITVIGDITRVEVFRYLPKLYNGKIFEIKKVISLTGKRVEAWSNQKILLDVDGEQPGQLPVTIDMVPGVLPLFSTVS